MPRIVSIHSFRGGTGKSNVTANVAATLAARGHRVGIVDTDIQSPGIHVLFGLDDESIDRTLNDYLWGLCPIEEVAHDVSSVVSVGSGGVAVLNGGLELFPSSIKANEIARILREGYDVGMLNDGYNQAIERLDLEYLFIDTHPGVNEETLLSIAISDVLIVILRPDSQDYQGTAVTVDVARKLGVPNLIIVVNKVLPEFDFQNVKQRVEDTYGAPVAGVLPHSDDMIRLGSAGLFAMRNPDDLWSQTIGVIADQIEQ